MEFGIREGLAVVEKEPLAFGDFGEALDDGADRREDQIEGHHRDGGEDENEGAQGRCGAGGEVLDERVDDYEQRPNADDAQDDCHQGLDQLAGEWTEAGKCRLGSEKLQPQPNEDDYDRRYDQVANYRQAAAFSLCPRFQCL